MEPIKCFLNSLCRVTHQVQIPKRGTAVVIALVLAAILIQMAIIYTFLVKSAAPGTSLLEEKTRAEFAANSVFEKAILKFQLFPSDYYAAFEAANSEDIPAANRSNLWLNDFIQDAALTKNILIQDSVVGASSFSATISNIRLYTIASTTRWRQQAIEIQALVNYSNRQGDPVTRTISKNFHLERQSNF